MSSSLTDLDELVLECRNDRARTYITEAVASYRAGAFRSAIVACWIAVCFDVIDKLQELTLAGDKEAEKQVEELEKTRRSGDVAKALRFERELLVLARDKFELISHLEFIDLERLQADRNRCAHPSLISEAEAYSPSAELARVHIYSVVRHLLRHPPVQGKYALDRLLKEIDSEYFPTREEEAKKFFLSGPLRKPRESLVRNLTLILIKKLLREDLASRRYLAAVAALLALGELHPNQSGLIFAEKLSPLMRAVQDANLSVAISFLSLVPDCWHHLDDDVRQRLQYFTEHLPANDLNLLPDLLAFEPLLQFAEVRVRAVTKTELSSAMWYKMPPAIAERIIDLYLESTSFDTANTWSGHVVNAIPEFTSDQARKLVIGIGKNIQILGSFGLKALIRALRAQKIVPPNQFEELLRENKLAEFAIELHPDP